MPESTPNRKGRNLPSPERIAATRRQHVLLLGLLVIMVFASVLGGGFVWSDREDLLQGAHRIDSAADIPAALTNSRDAFRSLTLGGQADPGAGTWQPLAVLANTLGWALWGDCAFCFHLLNVLLHLALVIGLYALGRHLLSHRRHGNRIAAWAAAIFAVHPATVSSVAWIGGLPHLLAAAFSVWTLVIFTRLPATTKSRPGHTLRWLIALGLTSTAAMLSHETSFMLPLLAILVAAFESKERDRAPLTGISPRRLKGLGVLIGALLLMLLYRRLALGGLDFAAAYPTDNVFNNAGMALRHLWFLIGEAMLPSEPIVSDAWPVTQAWGAAEVASLLGFLVVVVATAVGWILRHPSALGVAWFLLWVTPGVGVFPSDFYHDGHTLYLAVWGISFALAFAILQLWRPVGRQLVPGSEALAFGPIILVLGVITAFSNVRWWDHKGLFESEIASDPHYMVGRMELAKAALQRNDAVTALNHVTAAIESSRDPLYTGHWSARDGYEVLGRAQMQLGLHGEAGNSFATALEVAPNDAQIIYWLGVSEILQGQYEGAEESFRLALTLRQAFPEASADLGVSLAGQQRFAEAYPLLVEAIDQGLGNARRHRALALIYIDGNRLADAQRHIEACLALGDDATERARLAWVLWRRGETDRAFSELQAADRLSEKSNEYVDWVRAQIEAPSTEG